MFFDLLRKPTDILVLGNGFDMHCGLHSSFKYYFESSFLDSNNNPIFSKIYSNIWNLVFYYAFMLPENKGGTLIKKVNNNNPLWMDVEEYINKIFEIRSGLLFKLPLYTYVSDILRSNESVLFNDAITMSGKSQSLNGNDKEQRYHIKQKVLALKDQFGYLEPIELFYDELRRFEKNFCVYLSKEISNNEVVYCNNIQKFILGNMDNFGSKELFVISFNYTNKYKDSVYDSNILFPHGTLDQNNIIIGIGDNNGKVYPKADVFKKIKRRMNNGDSGLDLPEASEIKNIYFYGCSMGMLDYSYYSFLLKKYGLGVSNIKFVFLYSNYENTDAKNKANFDKYENNIEKVISRYCKENNIYYDFYYFFNNRTIQLAEYKDNV